MGNEEAKLAALRRDMVQTQLRARGIFNQAILDAFMEVPRDRFVPPDRSGQAYEDSPVLIGYGQTISQPYIVALMLQELVPKSHHRVLDVGAGSGYQTALLCRLAGHVYAVERIEALTERAMLALGDMNVRNVTFRTSDGSLGWPEEAPFDGIICGAGAPEVPAPWLDQLVEGGRIVMPVGGWEVQTLITVEKRGGKAHRREVCGVRFVKLIGSQGWTEADW